MYWTPLFKHKYHAYKKANHFCFRKKFKMPSGMLPDGLFDAFRTNGAPTYYGPNQTPWEADILEAGFIFAFVILAISFFVVLPGIRGKEVSIMS